MKRAVVTLALALMLTPALTLTLTACSSLYDYEPASYTVRAGDTLYSIAWRRGIDPQALARWNGIANPDRIAVGQRLVLSPRAGSAPARPGPAATTAGTTDSGSRPPSAAAPSRPAASSGSPPSAMPAWQWPVRGPIVASFGDRRVLSTGIGIGGALGRDVAAAAGGRVVYVGNGLPDYGELIIVEHSDSWLSAYGHNQRVLVRQGETVARGQKIAEMGPGPGGAARLHFEIRRNGDAVDPLFVLPD